MDAFTQTIVGYPPISSHPSLATALVSTMSMLFKISALSPILIADIVGPLYNGTMLMASIATVAAAIVTFLLNIATGWLRFSSFFIVYFSISSGCVVAGWCRFSSTSLLTTVTACIAIKTPVVSSASRSPPFETCVHSSHTSTPVSAVSAASVSL